MVCPVRLRKSGPSSARAAAQLIMKRARQAKTRGIQILLQDVLRVSCIAPSVTADGGVFWDFARSKILAKTRLDRQAARGVGQAVADAETHLEAHELGVGDGIERLHLLIPGQH